MKGFRLNIIIRAIAIVASSLLLAWVLTNREWFFTPLVIVIVISVLVWNLIYYVEKTSRNLSLFLLNIKQHGYASSFKNKNDPKHGLYKVFDDVIEEFQSITMEKEANYLYLQTLNENIGVGLISYDELGKIDLYNKAAKSILKKPVLQKIEQLGVIDTALVSLVNMASGERKVVKTVINNELIELSAICKKFKVKESLYTLLILQNINAELEQKEIEAWQKLISVLTHEIMNSVTPISSLSGALNSQLQDVNLASLQAEDQEDIKKSLVTIESRSKGLMRFVNAYKEFTKSPELNYSQFLADDILQEALKLLQTEINEQQIEIKIHSQSELKCTGDKELLTHVVINLIKNAIDILSTQNSKKITIGFEKVGMQNEIAIADNGLGIPEEMLDKIFVPFFTTKSKGTGVGLSFARKVMRLHNGQIKVLSKKGQGTKFTLIW